MKYLFVFLVGCSAAPVTGSDSATVETSQCASTCAHCCEPQPYINETKDGTMFTEPIVACSSSDLPADWSVAWCMSDCEASCPQ